MLIPTDPQTHRPRPPTRVAADLGSAEGPFRAAISSLVGAGDTGSWGPLLLGD